MGYRKDFVYVDVHSSALRQWRRVRLDQVQEKLLMPSKNFKCFVSVQRYEKPNAEAGEKVWMPIFFDLDAADPGSCIEDLKRLHNYLTEILGIDHHYIRVFFSGKKGFHLIVEPEAFDIRPDRGIHHKVRKASTEIAELLDLKTFDDKVYSARRVLRVPNSIHEGTKLFKIELSLSEVSLGIDWIKKEAKRPKRSHKEEEPDDVPISEDAKAFWDRICSEYEEMRELENLRPSHKIRGFDNLPVCMDHLLKLRKLPRSNTGNRTILSMASYLKDAGKSESEAMGVLVPWAAGLENIGDAGEPKKVEAMVRSTVRCVYQKEPGKKDTYNFACKYILALSTTEHKIPCQQLECPAIKGKMQETKEVIDLELSEFSRSTYLGEKVRIPTLISGKAGTPYVVPKRIRFVCTPNADGNYCAACPVAEWGEASFEFDCRDQQILEIVNTTSARQWDAIRRRFGFPTTCQRNKPRVEEYMNIEEVRMSPAAMDISNFEKNEFVNRKGFYIGYPIQSNKRYKVVGFPVKEPRTQSSAFLFEDHERLETEVENFRMTDEVREELGKFRAKEGCLEEKWREIHRDLAHNVTRIWNREETAWAVDLVAHSVRGFRFRSEPFVKGWAELLIVGDSGQGKTSIVRRLVQDHYRVGEYISGGSARRTGLLYSYQENGKTWMLIWGALPLNDLGLVVIDEFGDLPEDQFAVMTDVRSSGIVKATGVVTAETYARVRLIALTNPKKGKHLAEFDMPVTAIKELVPAAEDIRRFDLACAVSSGEVAVETINRAEFETVPHVYTSNLCSTLIKWAWSRKETEVDFTDSASRMVLSEATHMAKTYYAGAIPLVEPADQRFKIARLAAACAARVFSCNEDGSKVVVKEEHVAFVVALLSHIYGHPNFKYREWSVAQKRTDVSGGQDLEAALRKIQMMPRWRRVVGLLMLPGQIELREVEATLDGSRAQAANVLGALRILGLVEKRWSRHVKTAKGNQLVNWALEKGKFTKEEIEKDMMEDGGSPLLPPNGGE